MKNFTKTIFILAILASSAVAFSSCSSNDKDEDDRSLSGTYTFQSIYNIIFYYTDGSVVDMRKEGILSKYMDEGSAEAFTDLFGSIDFRFTGDNVYLSFEGEEIDVPATYKISGGRLNIYEDGDLVLTFGYQSGSSPYFIWDFTTFKAAGQDVSSFTQMGISNFEMWTQMRKR